jgi:hypothetical protein
MTQNSKQERVVIRLRPHHLLCILTYVGEGYSKAFTTNFTLLVDELNKGDVEIEVIEGPDDICQPRLTDPMDTSCHCFDPDIAQQDKDALEDLKLKFGDRFILSKDRIQGNRQLFKDGAIRKACNTCPWYDLCSDVANNKNYEGTLLKA